VKASAALVGPRSPGPTRTARPSVLRSSSRRSTSARSDRRFARRATALAVARTPVSAPALVPVVSAALAASVQGLVVACARLATGYELCARRARELHVADVAGSLSTLHRAVTDELASFLAASGASVPRTKPTCSERLRWEWLASTGRLVDGAPERQVLIECARIEEGVAALVVALREHADHTDHAVERDLDLDLDGLRQVVTLLDRARAASVRLRGRARDSAATCATG